VASDSLIALSYYSIPLALTVFVAKRRDLAFHWVFLMFGAFIFACGTTHLLGIWTLWEPVFWLDGSVKAITAGLSLATAVTLWPLIPKALCLPSPSRLEELNSDLRRQIAERDEAVEKLKQSEERFRLLVEGVQDYAIYMIDPAGTVMTWNAGAERIKGYKAQEILGKSFRCFYNKEDVEVGRPARVLELAHSRGQYQEVGLRVRKDGSSFWAYILLTALRDSSGKLYGFSKIVRDVTTRKIEEEKFRSLLEAAPDAMVIVDRDGEITLVNGQTERLFRYTREELVGQPVEILIPERFRQSHVGHRAFFSKNMRLRPMGAGMELYARRKDGSEFPVEISLSPIETEQGTLVISAIRDITDRKQIEQKFRSVLESAPDAMVIVDSSGQINLVNSQTERLFGYAREALVGQPVEMLIPERFRLRHIDHRASFSKNMRLRPMGSGMELYALRKDGTEFPVEISLSPVGSGEETLVITAIRDITERKQIEAQLHEKERLATLGTTAAVFAHEIANPLNGIATALEIAALELQHTENRNPLIYDSVTMAYGEIQRLSSLLRDYRSIARPQRLQLEPTDVCQIVQDAITTIMRGHSASGVKTNIQFDQDLPLVDADKQKLKQVVLNLAKNAVEAMSDGGVLSARIFQNNARVIVEITDTGAGIPEGEDIFQLFRTTKPDGTGLGLPIVQQIVSEHRGSIEYESTPGKGTTFRISLPVSSARS
jgi:protein-histidine pros-kinase